MRMSRKNPPAVRLPAADIDSVGVMAQGDGGLFLHNSRQRFFRLAASRPQIIQSDEGQARDRLPLVAQYDNTLIGESSSKAVGHLVVGSVLAVVMVTQYGDTAQTARTKMLHPMQCPPQFFTADAGPLK